MCLTAAKRAGQFRETCESIPAHCVQLFLFPEISRKVLCRVKLGDFVYLDPPFSVNSRRVFREYDAAQFDFGSIWRLRVCLEELAASKVNFLVSYAVCNEAWFLAQGFKTKIVRVRRNVAGFAKHRRYARELLIWN